MKKYRIRLWLVAVVGVLVFAAGWLVGRQYGSSADHQAAADTEWTQIESLPEYHSAGAAKKAFEMISPGEGRYVFNLNQVYAEENNILFKWTHKVSNALLIIKTNDGLWDEIRLKNTDHKKINLSDYSAHKSLTWVLVVGESDEVMKGAIDLRKYVPPYERLRK